MQEGLKMVKWGGICLILLALLTVTISIIDISLFAYPLEGDMFIHQAITDAFSHNYGLREVLSLSSFLPLLIIPGSLGIYYHIKHLEKSRVVCAHYFAIVAMFAWLFANMLWPSINWYFSQFRYETPIPSDSLLILSGLNNLFFVYMGEYLRLLCAGVWIFLVSMAALKTSTFPKWLCTLGVVIALIFWIALFFRIFIGNAWVIQYGLNYPLLLSLWMFLVGMVLVFKPNN